MVEPLTGVYAALAEAEVAGARLAIEEINQSGGILGRQVELLVADSANDITAGVDKTRRADRPIRSISSPAMSTRRWRWR